MASLQAVFAETLAAMRKAIKRRACESDSDDDIERQSNRGQKLKRRARFVHEGQLIPPSGPEKYRETIEHAGYHRTIISRNPPLLDDEGYELDASDEEDRERYQEAAEEAAQLNPYANIRLENILAPLSAVTDLPTHPTMSSTYTSKTLTDLTNQACDLMHKENAALWKVKHLQTRLNGDHTWVPCGLLLGDHDLDYFTQDYRPPAPRQPDVQAAVLANGNSSTDNDDNRRRDSQPKEGDTEMADATNEATNEEAPSSAKPPDDETEKNDNPNDDNDNNKSESKPKHKVNGNTAPSSTNNPSDNPIDNPADPDPEQPAPIPSIQAPADPDFIPLDADPPFIHPLFIAPPHARPDRDLGIPDNEAEDLRRALQLWVQKQEEVCRGAKRLYEGLLKADRLRKTVLQWAKHEAHVGQMSDGEDWVDIDEWGLDAALVKGKDEDDEDSAQPTGKKTRARR